MRRGGKEVRFQWFQCWLGQTWLSLCCIDFFLPRQEIDFPEWLEKNKAVA